eukprot:gb/GECG01011991.1/.p1 GENE.gb/GECG01011991.1/~~gb/GECG01011991.1/.p1  ORF type:complete len:356 (+),score=32.42 gb/GECG01011991.1/:1-1068(+)
MKSRSPSTNGTSDGALVSTEKRAKGAANEYTSQEKALVCISYGVVSIAVSLTYKMVLSSFHFEAEFVLLACQQILGIGFCAFAKSFLHNSEVIQIPDVELQTFQLCIPIGILFVLNMGLGFYAIRLCDVPMFLTIRRTTTVFTLLFEYILLGKKASCRIIGAVGIIVGGAIVAGWNTLNTEYLGYLLTICNNVLSALYLNVNRKFGDETGVKGFGLLFYNALIAVPFSLILAYILGEVEYIAAFPELLNPAFLASLFLSSVLGILMTYMVLLCISVNSPLVTSITGNVKDVVSTVLGALFFGFHATVMNLAGLAISFFGAGMFTYAKFHERGQQNSGKRTDNDEEKETNDTWQDP